MSSLLPFSSVLFSAHASKCSSRAWSAIMATKLCIDDLLTCPHVPDHVPPRPAHKWSLGRSEPCSATVLGLTRNAPGCNISKLDMEVIESMSTTPRIFCFLYSGSVFFIQCCFPHVRIRSAVVLQHVLRKPTHLSTSQRANTFRHGHPPQNSFRKRARHLEELNTTADTMTLEL